MKSQNFGQKDIIFKILELPVIWASFKSYFWISHLKTVPGTNFQTQIINVNASLWYSKMASFRKNEGILVPICNIQITVTIQVTRLKVGSFPYLYTMNLYTNFHSFLKIWVSSPYYLSVWCGISHIFENYSYESCPTESSACRTPLYINNHLPYKPRINLCIYKSTELDLTFIKILNPKKRMLLF